MTSLAECDRYQPCDICGGDVDIHAIGHGKTQAGTFRHIRCHEQAAPPETLDMTFDPARPHTVRLYNCGHEIYGPDKALPLFCPECDIQLVHTDDIDS